MDDLISKQAAIDAIRASTSKYTGFMEMEMYTDDDAVEAIKGVPPAQRWIPCSERLPEEFYVLCCDNHGEMIIANPFECDDSDTGFSAESEDCYMYNCVAWMPLPEPYKGEES